MQNPYNLEEEQARRRTFAIISHPDAGKTTVTEKLLLLGGVIKFAGTIKRRKSDKYVVSDWMELEKKRGISVTTSVMQFPYKHCIINLLDTPGHEDFSEDTYRTLMAVDSVLMVIDAAKGVEERTIKLMNICRLRKIPIITFINKLDRDGLTPIELLDEIEKLLNIKCIPITWPLGMGTLFKGIYNLQSNEYKLRNPKEPLSQEIQNELQVDLELVRDTNDFGKNYDIDISQYMHGKQTPIFFGSAINNFGIQDLLDYLLTTAPPPQARLTNSRIIKPEENKFTGFVFKIQANMDSQHRDRIAFLRICSGKYFKGIKIRNLRIKRDMKITNALTFIARKHTHAEEAYPGDIIGLYNHNNIQIGDSFTQGEILKFTGIPHFAPELFCVVQSKNPLKMKALHKGLTHLSEEGAIQVFKPLNDNRIVLGAIGILQFDVLAHRLQNEYNIDCIYNKINIVTVRWVKIKNNNILTSFKKKYAAQLALDNARNLIYLAPTIINLNLMQKRWPEIELREFCEI